MKLVRDKIPQLIEKAGESHQYKMSNCSNNQVYKNFLLQKVQEEACELATVPSLEEMADLLETVYALAEHMGYSQTDIETVRLKKKEEKGGFTKGYLLELLPQEQGRNR